MANKEIIIKVDNKKIFFNPRLSIPIQQTNIPKEHLAFRSSKDIFWKVEMLGYKADIKLLKVVVKDYTLTDITGFEKQEPNKTIQSLYFDKFHWNRLEPLLIYYHKSKLKEYIFELNVDDFLEDDEVFNPPFKSQFERRIYKTTIDDSFRVSFSDCNFMLGCVTFKRHIKKIGKEVSFTIPNEHILAEFDNIKTWFAKKLKTKKIKVSASIIIKDHEVTETVATSEHINKITPELIESIKYQRTFALTKEPRLSKADKSLFTAEEMFAEINSEGIEGNVFNQSEEDILNFFLKESDIRNKKQLTYLADKQSDNYKLRYTLNPNFGFLFLIEGVKNNHFVWELLNSHATYIWSIEKEKQDVEQQFKRIEEIVNNIRTSGRENYKRAYRNNDLVNSPAFRVLKHKDIGSELVDDFPNWKSRINEQLT